MLPRLPFRIQQAGLLKKQEKNIDKKRKQRSEYVFCGMKKINAYLIICLFIGMQSFAQGEKKGWPSEERYNFIRECISTATPNLGEDSARFYCWCMQFKVEKKYPTIEAASTITEADMSTPEWQKDIKDCISGGTWTKEDRSNFLSECTGAAKEGMTAEKAKNYCECMLFKLEKKYPNPDDMGEITEAKLNSPDWKKMIQDCIDF